MCEQHRRLADGRLPGTCESCPMNSDATEGATLAQNYGCLPAPADIIRMKKASGHNWECHSVEGRVCKGLCHAGKQDGMDTTSGKLIRYQSWYLAGERAALDEAETGILVQDLTGPLFENAMSGRWHENPALRDLPWLRSPSLKYYHPGFWLRPGEKDTRMFFAAMTAPVKDEESGYVLRECVGLLELQTSPHDPKEAWLMYVSVAPEYQRRGLARRMLENMAEHLRKQKQHLHRSRASEEGATKIQQYLDDFLDHHGIAWTQTGRDH